MRRQIVSCILAWLVLAGVASAQTVNPSKFLWTETADDHAITTRYELAYFYGTATAPVQTISIPVANVTAEGAEWSHPVMRPVLGVFTAKLKACAATAFVVGGELCSDWSQATSPFSLSLRVPAALRLQP